MKPLLKDFGIALILGGLLLSAIIIADIPGGYWSQGEAEIRWYKIDGVEIVNEKIQFKYTQLEDSDELTKLAIQVDPSFFTGCPVNTLIDLPTYQKGIGLASYLISNELYSAGDAGSLLFKAVPNPPHSTNGYIGAVACMVIGSILMIIGVHKPRKGLKPENI